MVKAILAGNKTQTRRKATVHDWPTDVTYAEEGWGKGKSPKPKWLFTDDGAFNGFSLNCPYGETGDKLWVRETWATSIACDDRPPSDMEKPGRGYGWPVWYAADGVVNTRRADPVPQGGTGFTTMGKCRPSIFMPRWASRITLEITAVRVQRLQEISEHDAEAEGCSHDFLHSDTCSNDNCALCGGVDDCEGVAVSAKENYRALWERINGKGSWAANPWVWVVTFKRVFNRRSQWWRATDSQ